MASSRTIAACLAVLLAGCAAPGPAAAPTATQPARLYPLPRLASPEYGMQVFLWWTTDGKTADNDVRLVKDAGFGWLKQKFAWRDIGYTGPRAYFWKKADEILALAEQHGMKLIVRLDLPPDWALASPTYPVVNGPPARPDDFGQYCGDVAERYAGRIAAYEVWNEPNLAREWGQRRPDPQAYVELLKACYLAIKQADPAAIVVSAGLAPTDQDDDIAMPDLDFYRAMYAAGAAPYFDALGVHAPGYMNPPERSPDDTQADAFLQSRVWTFRHVEDVRALMVEFGDGDKQIAITEMGWTTDPINPAYKWFAVTEQQQADYLVRAYQYARQNWQPWIGLMVTIYIAEPFWTEQDEQYWWAITRPVKPGDPPFLLPAYLALKDMQK